MIFTRMMTGRRNKYGAKKIAYGGEKADSKAEWQRMRELKLMERGGEIENLQTQVRFRLLPSQKDRDGKVLERPVDYIADFVYTDRRTGAQVVEDAKGMRTKDYVIKRKLMLYIHGIRVKEVRR